MKYKPLYLKSITEKQAGDEENFIIRGVFSSGNEDRQGDVVVQSGWILKEFLLNPVVLFAHDHWQPAVAKMIEIGLNAEGNLSGAIQFAAKEYDFAMTLYKLYAGGYMRAFSAGFDAIEGGYDDFKNVNVLSTNVLYEVSCVNVPANAEALAIQAGIDVTPLKKFISTQVEHAKAMFSKITGTDLEQQHPEDLEKRFNELKECGYESEQIDCMTYSICSKDYELKNKAAVEKAKCEIKARLDNLETATRDLTKTLTAIKKEGRQPNKKGRNILVKTLNQAIRSLVEQRLKLKSK
jgi:hypothetical protein